MKPALFLSLLACLAALPLRAQPTMAIVDFNSAYNNEISSIIPNVLTETLINSGQFAMFERERLDALLREQGLQSSGLLDTSTAAAIGQLGGIDYLMTGEIVDFGREVKSFTGYGVRSDTIFYRLEAAIRVIDTASGRIVFSKTAQVEEKQIQGTGASVSDTTIDTRLGRQVGRDLSAALLAAPVFRQAQREVATSAGITITSEPENASVEIDGIFYGNAGNRFEVPAGLHQIRVSLPGYEVWDKRVMVRDGASFHVPLVRMADIRVEVQEESQITTRSAD